jgi:hypothetical protein
MIHLDIIKHTQKKYLLINSYLECLMFFPISNINKFLKNLKWRNEISIIFVTVLKIMNLFSFNQYLFSDRTKLNLKKDYQALIILFYFKADTEFL